MVEAKVTKRYLEKRRLIDPETGCWLWTRAVDNNGRPKLTRNGKTYFVHRVAAVLWGLKDDYQCHGQHDHVLHHCDERLCFNPKHLYVGSHTDNMRDARARSYG